MRLLKNEIIRWLEDQERMKVMKTQGYRPEPVEPKHLGGYRPEPEEPKNINEVIDLRRKSQNRYEVIDQRSQECYEKSER
jgi:hypothetical protein